MKRTWHPSRVNALVSTGLDLECLSKKRQKVQKIEDEKEDVNFQFNEEQNFKPFKK